MEIAGGLSIASQMALLCPSGVDEWVRRELVGDVEAPHSVARYRDRGHTN